MTVSLTTDLVELLGPAQAALFAEQLDLHTVGELIRLRPRSYVRRNGVSKSAELVEGEWVTLVATVVSAELKTMRNRPGKLLRVLLDDGTHKVEATFFNPFAIARQVRTGVRLMVAGKLTLFNGSLQLTHPDWMVMPDDTDQVELSSVGSELFSALNSLLRDAAEAHERSADASSGDGGGRNISLPTGSEMFERDMVPIYRATAGLPTSTIMGAVAVALLQLPELDDALNAQQRHECGDLMSEDEAIRAIHQPRSEEEIERARTRLKFDEALALQLALAQRRYADRGRRGPSCPHVPGGLEDALRQRLPFELTGGQEQVIEEIGADLGSAEPMSRLLQGEVGSGKTLVALIAMLRMVDNGYQCALMAPTEVLAAQHLRSITTMLGDLATAGELGAADGATKVVALTGSMRTAAKKAALLDVVSGTAGIIIGTHALLSDNVTFFNLGLVVVDEQHRFGVSQRDSLRERRSDDVIPHLLVMTATPIPRTVAMTVYGDLETSMLTEMPKGRAPVQTTVVPARRTDWVARTWERLAEEIQSGRQVYVVCSRIGDEDSGSSRRARTKGSSKAKKSSAKSGARGKPDKNGTAQGSVAEGSQEKTVSLLDLEGIVRRGPLGQFRVATLHGRMPPDEKAAVMDEFVAGEIDVLVSTTVIEVGVDVANASAMLIVDAERFGVSQLHQLRGRVGRGRHRGLCLLLTAVTPQSPAWARLEAVAGSTDGYELALVDLAARREGDVLGESQSGEGVVLHYLSLLEDGDVIDAAYAVADAAVGADITLSSQPAMSGLVDAVFARHQVRYLDKA